MFRNLLTLRKPVAKFWRGICPHPLMLEMENAERKGEPTAVNSKHMLNGLPTSVFRWKCNEYEEAWTG